MNASDFPPDWTVVQSTGRGKAPSPGLAWLTMGWLSALPVFVSLGPNTISRAPRSLRAASFLPRDAE
jgi:hypothetical protein